MGQVKDEGEENGEGRIGMRSKTCCEAFGGGWRVGGKGV